MGWNAGTFLIAPGASVRVDFWWDGSWMGTQFALARPQTNLGPFLPPAPSSELETTNPGVGFTRRDTERPNWVYHVTASNPGSPTYVFGELTGGEVQP